MEGTWAEQSAGGWECCSSQRAPFCPVRHRAAEQLQLRCSEPLGAILSCSSALCLAWTGTGMQNSCLVQLHPAHSWFSIFLGGDAPVHSNEGHPCRAEKDLSWGECVAWQSCQMNLGSYGRCSTCFLSWSLHFLVFGTATHMPSTPQLGTSREGSPCDCLCDPEMPGVLSVWISAGISLLASAGWTTAAEMSLPSPFSCGSSSGCGKDSALDAGGSQSIGVTLPPGARQVRS